MKKLFLYLAIFIFVIGFWFGESRSFYCLDGKRCITVWKTYHNVCYIIPGKYYGIIKPSSNYIETSNTNLLTIYFSEDLPKSLIVQCEAGVKINNIKTDTFTLFRYETDTSKFLNLLYLPSAKIRSDMKSGAGLIDIHIQDNYARDKDGKAL